METGICKQSKKNIPLVLIYELLGSSIMTYSFSLGGQYTGVRAAAYLIGWIIASTISGAHFNPAVTLAVLIYERKRSYIKYFFMIITA